MGRSGHARLAKAVAVAGAGRKVMGIWGGHDGKRDDMNHVTMCNGCGGRAVAVWIDVGRSGVIVLPNIAS